MTLTQRFLYFLNIIRLMATGTKADNHLALAITKVIYNITDDSFHHLNVSNFM
jgi:hypothetical protein